MRFPSKIGLVFLVASRFAMGVEGSIEIIGKGEASAPPEFATIRVAVTSICYDLSNEAKNANAVLANQVVAILNQFVRSEKDKVIATGGVNQRQTEYLSLVNGDTRVLCERKWRATNSIILHTASLKEISDIQDKILQATDKMESIDPTKVAQTYAELMQPNFELYPETSKRLEKAAQNNALMDAKDQVGGFEEACRFRDLRLKVIGQPVYSSIPKAAERLYKGGTETPLFPENIIIRAVWKFIWSFDGSANCYR